MIVEAAIRGGQKRAPRHDGKSLLEYVLERLSGADSGEEIFGADEAAQWSGGALDVLSGLLGALSPRASSSATAASATASCRFTSGPPRATGMHGLSYPATNPKTWAGVPVELPAFDVDAPGGAPSLDHRRCGADALPARTSSRRRRWWRWAPSPARAVSCNRSRDSWLIVPNLWGGIVGDPSAKKSPA